MRQAITTKFVGPTNSRGSRYIATCDAGRLTHYADYALNYEANHAKAALKLAEKLGWSGTWFGGSTKKGYCFVWSDGSFPAYQIDKQQATV